MRVLGIDLGERRIGLAISDPMGMIAGPLDTWEGRDRETLPGRIANLVRERQIGAVVIGIPRRTDGKESDKVKEFTEIAEALKAKLGDSVPVELTDERFTTVIAHNAMKASGMKEKKRRQNVDKVAAAVILQGWLDSHPQRRPAGGCEDGEGF